MKPFSFSTEKGLVQIGLDVDNDRYNFTRLWETYKGIQSGGKGPDFSFLQIMVELDFLSDQVFEEVLNTVRRVRPLEDFRIEERFEWQVPISRPQKIIAIGRNYEAHAREGGAEVPDEPIFFAKAPSALLPHEGKIALPPDIGRVDHEVELAVVIGKSATRVPADDAMEHVAGYTILNDVTARAMQRHDIEERKPWFRSKSFDTFCPMGPYLVPRDAVQDPHDLELTLWVNGEVKQQASTRDMVFDIPALIEYISRHMTLTPGDIIATGTPEGISELKSGDLVECEITGLGRLRNPVVASSAR
jgi:2-keto-4-pentenoate hydratase/2-oxohepta-3-ene-1,7-dioic acid hydratase in catechol pathway